MTDFKDWLHTFPEVAPEISQDLTNMLMQFHNPQLDLKAMLIFTEAIAQELINLAQGLWDILSSEHFIQVETPLIFPGREEVIGFTWCRSGARRLDIWVRMPDEQYFADWSLSIGAAPATSGEVIEATDLLDVVYQYLFQ